MRANAAPMHPHCHCSTAPKAESVREEEKTQQDELKNMNNLDEMGKKSYNESVSKSGAVYGAWNDKNDPDEVKRKAHAEQYYNSVRNRSTKNEIERISKNTGFSKAEIEAVYNHVFENYYSLEGGMKRFDSDYDMVQSWERLFSGKNIQPHDLTLLRHELLESKLMAEGLDYDTAHRITQKEHDYLADLVKWQIERGDL